MMAFIRRVFARPVARTLATPAAFREPQAIMTDSDALRKDRDEARRLELLEREYDYLEALGRTNAGDAR